MKITMYKCDECGKEASGEQVHRERWVCATGPNRYEKVDLCGMTCATIKMDRELPEAVERLKGGWRKALKRGFDEGRYPGENRNPYGLPCGLSLSACGGDND